MAARLAEVEATLRRLASENDALKAEMKIMIDNSKTKDADSAPEPVLGVPLVNVGAPIVHSPKDFEGVSLDGKHKVFHVLDYRLTRTHEALTVRSKTQEGSRAHLAEFEHTASFAFYLSHVVSFVNYFIEQAAADLAIYDAELDMNTGEGPQPLGYHLTNLKASLDALLVGADDRAAFLEFKATSEDKLAVTRLQELLEVKHGAVYKSTNSTVATFLKDIDEKLNSALSVILAKMQAKGALNRASGGGGSSRHDAGERASTARSQSAYPRQNGYHGGAAGGSRGGKGRGGRGTAAADAAPSPANRS